ncbi:hypothetical protein GRS48_11775 [Halorubrum sp. JWXQ-INN 858]|uniref:DUF7344 domain-containing protein n=1 Tax=Halorubrum sp. JWXQ-INN 858 TaxID=2690782 RepID=UPI0013574DC2|nr:hypothetical protein [Halorubrum sp. JWXQ-INN 858]MWV65490.1 hypothetical protein [Halorubrum sp. JWXQ-INN 858]
MSSAETESRARTDVEDDGPEQGPSVPSAPSTELTQPSLSLDVVFDVLKNQRRRHVMSVLEEGDGSTTLSDLAEHIAGIENDKPPHSLNAQERKRVYVGLYQCHLPKMDDAEAIVFDQNRGTVERGPKADVFHTYLERDIEPERCWYRYYGAIAGASCLALAAALVSGVPSPAVVFVGSMIAIGGLAVHHARCQP